MSRSSERMQCGNTGISAFRKDRYTSIARLCGKADLLAYPPFRPLSLIDSPRSRYAREQRHREPIDGETRSRTKLQKSLGAKRHGRQAEEEQGAKTRKDQGADRIKTSVLLSRSVDIKIRALSGIRGVDKSTLINSLLEEATRGVVVSLRGPLADGGAGEADTASRHEDETESA